MHTWYLRTVNVNLCLKLRVIIIYVLEIGLKICVKVLMHVYIECHVAIIIHCCYELCHNKNNVEIQIALRMFVVHCGLISYDKTNTLSSTSHAEHYYNNKMEFSLMDNYETRLSARGVGVFDVPC